MRKYLFNIGSTHLREMDLTLELGNGYHLLKCRSDHMVDNHVKMNVCGIPNGEQCTYMSILS